MHPSRIIYDDAPAFIPVPAELQHRRVEAIFWPLEAPEAPAPRSSSASPQAQSLQAPPALSLLIGKAKGCFENPAAVDTFLRAERDAWER